MGFDGRRNGGAIGNVVVVERKRQLGGRIAGFLGLGAPAPVTVTE